MEAERNAKTHTETSGNGEALGYPAIVSVAAALRFWNLAAAPLTTREAAQALARLHGAPLPAGGSPALYALNQILFAVFGGSVGDVGVRLGAATLGTLLGLLPILWRKRLGVYGALLASAAIAVSPTFVLASRTLDGAIVTATCSVAVTGFALRYLDERRKIDVIGRCRRQRARPAPTKRVRTAFLAPPGVPMPVSAGGSWRAFHVKQSASDAPSTRGGARPFARFSGLSPSRMIGDPSLCNPLSRQNIKHAYNHDLS